MDEYSSNRRRVWGLIVKDIEMKKIAFCKFAGLANGGTQKYLQTIALLYKKYNHSIDFFYTNSAPPLDTAFVHPENSPDRINLLKQNNINLIPITVEYKTLKKWINSDFEKLFNQSDYHCLVTANDGREEYPYNILNDIPIIHTIHGVLSYDKPNIKKSVLLCKWQANKWLENGGNPNKLEIIPGLVYVPDTWTVSFRERYKIPNDAFVFGLHQAKGVGSTISLDAFSKIKNPNIYYAILGGSDIHRQYCKQNSIQNVIFMESTSSVDEIHDFLDGIDVYAHCRIDGEVCSASITEAMYHKKPIISFIGDGSNLGHVEQIEGCGKMTYSAEEYFHEMMLLQNKNYYQEMADKVWQKYNSTYHYKKVEQKFLELIGNPLI
jgi:hypothetical protein